MPLAKITSWPDSSALTAASRLMPEAIGSILIALCTTAGIPAAVKKSRRQEGVHHGREHAHIVGVDPVHAAGAAHHAAPDVAGADHERDFDALVHDFLDLPDHLADGFGIVAVILRALERFAADLEQHPVEAEFLIHAVTLSAKLNCTRFEYTMKSPISPRKTAIEACFYRKNVYITP